MTTDDGLKGLTDEQIVALYSELRHTSKEFCGLPHPMKNWTEEHDAAIANAARAWLAANVHDSGDGDRLDFLESLAVADIDEQAITRLAIFNLWRGTTYDNLRAAIDAAILAEKGEG